MLSAKLAGDTKMFRIAHRPGDVFSPTAWIHAGVDGRFHGRFDDPMGDKDLPQEQRFRSIYTASDRQCIFAESLQHARLSFETIQKILDATDDDEEDADDTFAGIFDPEFTDRGVVRYEWRTSRQVGHAYLDPYLRFADIAHATSLQHLRLSLSIENMDLSAATSDQRELTCQCARYVYELTDATTWSPSYAGIRYLSHIGGNWECWAIFDDRIALQDSYTELSIAADDPDLVYLAEIYRLSIETIPGHFFRP